MRSKLSNQIADIIERYGLSQILEEAELIYDEKAAAISIQGEATKYDRAIGIIYPIIPKLIKLGL